jgi:hypothetical protein
MFDFLLVWVPAGRWQFTLLLRSDRWTDYVVQPPMSVRCVTHPFVFTPYHQWDYTVGVDLAMSVIQIYAVDAAEKLLTNWRQLTQSGDSFAGKWM